MNSIAGAVLVSDVLMIISKVTGYSSRFTQSSVTSTILICAFFLSFVVSLFSVVVLPKSNTRSMVAARRRPNVNSKISRMSSSTTAGDERVAFLQKCLDDAARLGYDDSTGIPKKIKAVFSDHPYLLRCRTVEDFCNDLAILYNDWIWVERRTVATLILKLVEEHFPTPRVEANSVASPSQLRLCSGGQWTSPRPPADAVTFQERGRRAKTAAPDSILPQPVSAKEADEFVSSDIWNKAVKEILALRHVKCEEKHALCGDECGGAFCDDEGEGTSKQKGKKRKGGREPIVKKLLSDCHKTDLFYKWAGYSSGECGSNGIVGKYKPGIILQFDSEEKTTHLNTVALISMHSGGGAYDSDTNVGELITYGLVFLKRAENLRNYIILGITDLQSILWFRLSTLVTAGSSVTIDGYEVTLSGPFQSVRESLAAYFLAGKSFLEMSLHLDLPDGWQCRGILGSGKTSDVFRVESSDGNFAMKVLRPGFQKSTFDKLYLKKLEGIDGVPCIYKVIKSMLIISPIGVPFTFENVQGYNVSFDSLVDILHKVHDRGIVNRDIRPDNIMIVPNKHGKHQLFILDWGFAAEASSKSLFSGSLHTASDHVLGQYLAKQIIPLKYEPADDLVSLVRSLRIFCDSKLYSHLKRQNTTNEIIRFWAKRATADEVWYKAEVFGMTLAYAELKDILKKLQKECMP